MYSGKAIDYFPVNKVMKGPRAGQTAVINEIDRVLKETSKKIILLEAPVGSGKSGIAMAFANAFKSSHVITPRKSLQDQYFEDFGDEIVLMKGRGSYPCTIDKSRTIYLRVVQEIKKGQIRAPGLGETSCAVGPCKESEASLKMCRDSQGDCPYSIAMETAQGHHTVVHNLHSFIFQTAFSEKFEQRDLMVIDEAHEIEGVVREFITKKFTLNRVIPPKDRPTVKDVDVWCDFFLKPEFVPQISAGEAARKKADETFKTPADEYRDKVELFRQQKNYFKSQFIVKASINTVGIREVSTTFEFIPENLGSSVPNLLLAYGKYTILMSGTIYSKDIYCRNLGINPDDVHFIRIPSSFPIENRPIILKKKYQVDTSFAKWNENFDEMVEKIETVMKIFGDAKGLIHSPSYEAGEQIARAVRGNRLMTHSKHDMQEKLAMFYASKEPTVFVSPVCQQGVDFKQDRARFQIVVRVPYMNTSDEFVNHKVQNDFPWYNMEALKIWGQQLGRVNRSEDDYGATFLMDSRFNNFIKRNSKLIPQWVQKAFIWN